MLLDIFYGLLDPKWLLCIVYMFLFVKKKTLILDPNVSGSLEYVWIIGCLLDLLILEVAKKLYMMFQFVIFWVGHK